MAADNFFITKKKQEALGNGNIKDRKPEKILWERCDTGENSKRGGSGSGILNFVNSILTLLAAGSLFSLTAARTLSGGMWFMQYKFMITPMLVVFSILLIMGGLAPYLAFGFGRKGTVVEELQKE